MILSLSFTIASKICGSKSSPFKAEDGKEDEEEKRREKKTIPKLDLHIIYFY